MAWFRVLELDQDPRVFVIDRPVVVIGRIDDADLRLVDTYISRRHARVTRNGSAYTIEDLGSSNGILVNGESVDQHTLSTGDSINFIKFQLEFNGDESPVFQMRPGKPWTEHFYKVQRKIFGSIGRDGRRGLSHALRHASITDMFQAQVPLNVIMAHHGHRQVSTTMRYAHAQEAALKAAAAELAKRRKR